MKPAVGLAFGLAVLLAPQDGPGAVTVPLEVLKSKHVAIQVKVNGKGPYRLIFDTGAPVTLVSNRLAREAGVTIKGSTLFGVGEAEVERFEAGEARVDGLRVVVMNHPTIQAMEAVVGRLDGIVGLTFFSRFDATIDYQAATLRLAPCGYRAPDLLQSMNEKMMGGLRGGAREPTVAPRRVLLGVELEERPEGAVVSKVAAGGAAHAAGLKAGDRIVLFDGRWILNPRDLVEAVSLLPPGEAVPVKVRRGKAEDAELTLRARRGL